MARLPKPGADAGNWAELLNEFLLASHNPDGTLRTSSIPALTSGTVGLRNLSTVNAPSQYQVLSNDGANLIWQESPAISVTDFGAVGDGVTDDTAAIQHAIDSAHNLGGQIIFPSGNFMVTGLTISAQGTALSGSARWGTRISRLSGSKPLINVSGNTSVTDHIKYCSLLNILLNGNSMPGVLLQSYYADNCIYSQVNFIHCAGLATDFVEVWDTVIEDAAWEDCGSATQPALLLRNSTARGTFGFSNDNTNQIHFHNCRWESFRNGAIRLDGAANGSTSLLNGIFFVSCKMESLYVAGPVLQIMQGTTIVFIDQLYIAIDAYDAGYATPVDAIEDSGTFVVMFGVYVEWGAAAGPANSVIHVLSGTSHSYHQVSSFLPTGQSTITASIIAGPASSQVVIVSLWTSDTTTFSGNVIFLVQGSTDTGYALPIDNTGTFRVTSSISGNDIIKVDNNSIRPAFEVVNGLDAVGFSDNYTTQKWRINGLTGAMNFAAGKFQVEGTKGYTAINATPYRGNALLINVATPGDVGIVLIAPAGTSTTRLMQFEDQTHTVQGMAFDYDGRPLALGTPARVTPGAQVSYANPGAQVRDIAGNITAAVKPSPTTAGAIATITFSRPYAAIPLNITVTDQSATWSSLYVSARSAAGFTVSTRNALPGGSILNFDYLVIA